jgi:hypothetical protein
MLIKNPRQYPDQQPKPHPVPTKMLNSFYSNSQRKERMENKYPEKATTAIPFWDPNSNWRAPGMSTAKKLQRKGKHGTLTPTGRRQRLLQQLPQYRAQQDKQDLPEGLLTTKKTDRKLLT